MSEKDEKTVALHKAWHFLFQKNPTADTVLALWSAQSFQPLDWFWTPVGSRHQKALTLLDTFWMAVNPREVTEKSQATWGQVWDMIQPQIHWTQDVSEAALLELSELPSDEPLVDHVLGAMNADVWVHMSATCKAALMKNAVFGDHVGLLRKMLSQGEPANGITKCQTDLSVWKGSEIDGPWLANVRSSQAAACLLEYGADPTLKMGSGVSVLEFLKTKGPKLFINERERKATWAAVETSALQKSDDPEQRKNLCLEGLQTATQPAELRFALKRLAKDEWRTWSFPGGGTLAHYVAFVQPDLFDVFARTLKLTEADLQAKDQAGADVFTYFVCAGATRPKSWDDRSKEAWVQTLNVFAKGKTGLNLWKPEGLLEFSNQALHVLNHLPKQKNNNTPLDGFNQTREFELYLWEIKKVQEGKTLTLADWTDAEKGKTGGHETVAKEITSLLRAWQDSGWQLMNRWDSKVEDQWRVVAEKHKQLDWLLEGWVSPKPFLKTNQSAKSWAEPAQEVLKDREVLTHLEGLGTWVKRKYYASQTDKDKQPEIERRWKERWADLTEGMDKGRWTKLLSLVERGSIKSLDIHMPEWLEAKNVVERHLLRQKTAVHTLSSGAAPAL